MTSGQIGAVAAASELSSHGATLTIEQLAAQSGMTVRNIRSHQARGLLAPPEVRDRVGYYDSEHVARLRLIVELQSEGFNLRGIKRLLEETGGGSEHLVALRGMLATPFETEQRLLYAEPELTRRWGPQATPAALALACEVGVLVAPGDGRYEAPAPSLVDAAAEVVSLGVPLEHALAVVSEVDAQLTLVAREFVRLFLDDVWQPFVAAGCPEERWAHVLESIERLRPLSTQAVLAVYRLTMSREVEDAFGREVARLAKDGGPHPAGD